MNQKHLVTIAACFAANAAAAADLPSLKAPPPPPPPAFTWTGPYVGLSIGYGWANTNRIDGVALDPVFLAPTGVFWAANSPRANGVIGGVQVGYNYQINGTGIVLGLETDFLGSDIQGDTLVVGTPVTGTAVTPFAVTHHSLDWFGTVRGRVGYAIMPSLLIYGTGGFAYGQTSTNFAIGFSNGFFDGAFDRNTRTGWTAGAGVEWAFMPNLSLRLQYLYVDLGHDAFLLDGGGCRWGCKPPPVPPAVPVAPATFISGQTGAQNQFHNVTVGLNYRFNLFGGGGPVAPAPVLGSY
ncbi:MAG: outer membrane protein [Methylocystis sp.]